VNDINNTQQTDIPDSAFVNCPLSDDYPLVRINTHCIECEYLVGLGKNESPRPLPFFKKFKIGCSHPVYRQIIEVKV